MSRPKKGWGALAATAATALTMLTPGIAHAVTSATLSDPSQADPLVGETVTFTVTGVGLLGISGSEFQLRDGVNPDNAPYATKTLGAGDTNVVRLSTSFATPGAVSIVGWVYKDGGDSSIPGSQTSAGPKTVTVRPLLTGSISTAPASAAFGSQITLGATGAGGKPGLTYTWDVDGDGFDDGVGQTITPTINTGTGGPRTFRVQISDSASPAHVITASKDVTITGGPTPAPTPVPTATPAPTAVPATPGATPAPTVKPTTPVATTPPCTKRLAWATYEVTTTGCFTPDAKKARTYSTTSAVQVNGLGFTPSAANPFTVVAGDAKNDGSVTLSGAQITALGINFFKGKIDWTLPTGKRPGTETEVGSLDISPNASLYGFGITGKFPILLGLNNAGRYYANLVLSVKLPEVFKAGPNKDAVGLTSKIVLSIDKNGISNTGFKIEAKNAWLGKLQIESVCFAYAAAGETAVDGCEAPSLDGKPYITCAQDTNQARWSGSAVVVLPTGSNPRLAAFGSVSGGKIASLGGFADNLGTSVPLASGVYLNRVGVGVCINPPPFKLRGDVGVAVLPVGGKPTVAVNGYFLYTDANGATPWSLELGGTVYVLDKQLGSGSLIITGNGSIDFAVEVEFGFSIVKINGGVNGWIEPAIKRFLVQGYIQGCIGVICARADGLVSNLGLAACVDLGTITYWTLERDSDWTWWAWWRLHWETHVVKLKGGFGYTWQPSSLSLLGSSCDFGAWTPSRTAYREAFGTLELLGLRTGLEGTRAAAGPNTVTIEKGTPAVSLKIKGNGGAPKITTTGPDGTVVASDPASPSAQSPGKWTVAENPTDNSTSVLLINPAAGDWNFQTLDGSPAIVTIETSPYEGSPQIIGGVGDAKGGKKVLNLGFQLPPGTKLTIEESGSDAHQTLSTDVKPGVCDEKVKASPAGDGVKCASLVFSPAPGTGGERKLEATVTRDGLELSRSVVATYKAKAWAKPAKPTRLGVARKGSNVTVSWGAVRGADSYAVTVEGSDGTSTAFNVASKCRAVRLAGVPADATIKATVLGVRSDKTTGPKGVVKLGSGKKASGKRLPAAKPRCS